MNGVQKTLHCFSYSKRSGKVILLKVCFFRKCEKTCFSVTGISYMGRKMMMA